MQCLYELLFVVAFVVRIRAGHVIVQKSSDHRIRLVLYSDTKNCRQLHSGTARTAVLE